METISAGAQKLKKGLRQNKICHVILFANQMATKKTKTAVSQSLLCKKTKRSLDRTKDSFSKRSIYVKHKNRLSVN